MSLPQPSQSQRGARLSGSPSSFGIMDPDSGPPQTHPGHDPHSPLGIHFGDHLLRIYGPPAPLQLSGPFAALEDSLSKTSRFGTTNQAANLRRLLHTETCRNLRIARTEKARSVQTLLVPRVLARQCAQHIPSYTRLSLILAPWHDALSAQHILRAWLL